MIGLFTSNSAGFFWPSSPHRLPHDSKWPNPALFGALISGLIHTSVCYFTTVFPHILPQFQSDSQSQLVWESDYYQCLACEVLGWLSMKILKSVHICEFLMCMLYPTTVLVWFLVASELGMRLLQLFEHACKSVFCKKLIPRSKLHKV